MNLYAIQGDNGEMPEDNLHWLEAILSHQDKGLDLEKLETEFFEERAELSEQAREEGPDSYELVELFVEWLIEKKGFTRIEYSSHMICP